MPKLDIKIIKNFAKSRGGVLLSSNYKNSKTKLLWKCKEDHEWEATYDSIRSGSWCPKCAGNIKYTIGDMQNIAQSRGGKCLGKVYVNNSTKLKWQCGEGHQWEAVSANIINGAWCPQCAALKRGYSKRKTIKDCKEIAARKGGICISTVYETSKKKLKWQCRECHQWEATYDTIRNSWCPKCGIKSSADKKRGSFDEYRRIAESKGGKCLSTYYKGSTTKLKWQCKEGHQWEAVPSSIKQGKWCPKCAVETRASSQRLDIQKAKSLAISKNGKCLSERYINSDSKLKWECSEGHQWNAVYYSVSSGSWCPKCAGKQKNTIDELKKVAISRNGKCLNVYYNVGEKLVWECEKGHRWKARADHVKRGSWCPVCGGSQRLTLEHAIELGKSKFGRCLSNEYINSSSKLLWECAEGHQWKASYNSVSRISWCPICSQGLSERICRAYFEQAFGEKFPLTRSLKWLKTPEAYPLELDGYCKKLSLAFEHQGEHHYTDKAYFEETKYDDLKKKLCKDNGVTLICIPQLRDRIPYEELPTFIGQELQKQGFPFGNLPQFKDIDLENAYHPKWINELKKVARQKQGKCLSDKYLGNNIKLKWECKEGHIWKATPLHIKSGTWCPKCGIKSGADKKRSSIIEYQLFAKKKGGLCLSKNYKNNRTKLKWQCGEGHQWDAVPSSIKKGVWCPECANEYKASKLRGSLKDAIIVAESRGGKCLSKEYKNANIKLEWECAERHQWQATFGSVKSGTWCPECANQIRGFKRRLTIHEMRKIAEERGGQCLSTIYTNNSTPLVWQCDKGHKWEARPGNIKSGKWCPECAGRLPPEIN